MQILVEQIKGNDRKAQEILYKKYADRFFYLCYRYTGNEDNASDVLNKGFLKIFNNIYSLNFINNKAFEGWMYKILINEALYFIRESNRQMITAEIERLDYSSEAYIDHHFSEEDCLKLLQMLPMGYRTVFNLFAIEGFSHQEIGAMLNITESTSRSQLTRARDILKTLINKEL